MCTHLHLQIGLPVIIFNNINKFYILEPLNFFLNIFSFIIWKIQAQDMKRRVLL